MEKLRDEIEKQGGSVGILNPMANWVELHGIFTPAQLKQLAKEIEEQYGNTKRPNDKLGSKS